MNILSRIILFSLFLILITETQAQRGSRRRPGTTPAPGTEQPTTAPDNTTQPPQGGRTGRTGRGNAPAPTTQPSGYNPYGNVPIEVDTLSGSSAVGKSLRNLYAFDKSALAARTPLQYEHLRWDDALFSETVWRELDLREKMNQVFRYDAVSENGSELFINILMNAVKSGEVTAFADDAFTTPIDSSQLSIMTAGNRDTVPVYDPNDINKIIKYVVTSSSFDPKLINRIRIREEWVFDREASRLFCRIIGICPVKTKINELTRKEQYEPMFWVYYPDMRPTFARHEVYNPKNMGASRMTWEELWESRMFASYITKSTIDNPSNRPIRTLIKDPILALLEGENIKEKIFNYEQDLWEY